MARRYWPDGNPVGKRITFPFEKKPREIVGVIAEVKRWGPESESRFEAYIPYYQTTWPLTSLVIRSRSETWSLAEAVRSQAREMDRDLPLYDIKTMEERLAESTSARRFNTLLFGVFSAVGVILAAVGVFGVTSHSVSQRSREMAIRMALGAQRRRVLTLVIQQTMALVLLGVGVGLVASYYSSSLVASLLYAIRPTDIQTYVGGSVFLVIVALVATYLPARRATAVDPAVVLRYE